MATRTKLQSYPASAEPRLARGKPGLSAVEAPAREVSLVATLRESKEVVFILAGITLAFGIHFGFGDFVSTESSTPKIRNVADTNELGDSARVRAAAFERAAERAARRRRAARRERARRAARAAAAAARATPSAAARRAPVSPASPSPASSAPAAPRRATPAPRPAAPRPTPAPAKRGGGGQSFDDSG